mmetsp:Transcript_29846/g.49248  ORF Transcript_29846/g.49248 Transcript_29846/m.49248 type:complete len:476 (-) Transcript_29846:114-1541(-)|eukprot:CAMPEP_0119021198 /NCGR_PEP_ID=MMETSP1176-20130426/25515_1 /TAXON_ID=265551 /ORGANISM="Synedropsis recta cf, Strain CCMP1620" /LENGTH=475 /DNA_ID=CAMNT_0006975757 /DNA_START=77 /DNA_END=1504 /DNA_ORIENTATION=+
MNSYCKALIFLTLVSSGVDSFAPSSRRPSPALVSSSRATTTNNLLLHATTKTLDGDDDDICRIQILMSDTGGGHRASANALRDAFDVLHPGKIECDIVDIFTDYGPFWPYNDYPRCYKIMAEYSFLWEAFYRFGETPIGLALNEFFMETFCFDAFTQCLARPSGSSETKRADMVVSVHPLCQDIPIKILSSLDSQGASRAPEARTTPFCTVVTDLGGAHPTWFNKNGDKCFVPSDALYQLARDRGVQPAQIVQKGLPIRSGFWSTTKKEKSQETLRTELKIDTELPTVLLVGGGDGMGGIVDIAKSLGDRLGSGSTTPQYQMVVVCGNNQKAQENLNSANFGQGVKVSVQGFVNNMDEWMQASDALVTKAGPGTIAEASICGLPCMLFSYLPGQEEGNVPFVEDAGFGTYSGDPQVIAETVSEWLASPAKMEELKNAALDAARPAATLDIAKDLADIVFKAKQSQPQSVLISKSA